MAKFTACIDLPNPLSSQAVIKAANRYGCYYRQAVPGQPRSRKARTLLWAEIMNGTIFDYTKAWTRGSARDWRHTLTPTERADWNTFALTTVSYSYDGSVRVPNGFECSYKCARWFNKLGFNPHFADVPTFSGYMNPLTGHDWQNLPAPVVSAAFRYGFGSVGMTFSNVPHLSNMFVLSEILRPGAALQRPSSWFNSWQPGQSLDPDDPDYQAFFQTDFPFYPPDTDARAGFALWYFDGDTLSWGPFSYVFV